MQEYAEHIAWRTLSTFWRASARKKSVYILRPCRVVGKDLKKVSEKVSLSRTLKYFQWIIKQLLNSAFVWLRCDELCRSRRMLSTSASVYNILPDLHNSSHPTQPRSIIANYYSFKIFPQFWLAKSTRLIHHNQLLMTKFGRILTLTRKWRQKCSVFAG